MEVKAIVAVYFGNCNTMEVSYLISVFTSVTVDLDIRGVLKVWQNTKTT